MIFFSVILCQSCSPQVDFERKNDFSVNDRELDGDSSDQLKELHHLVGGVANRKALTLTPDTSKPHSVIFYDLENRIITIDKVRHSINPRMLVKIMTWLGASEVPKSSFDGWIMSEAQTAGLPRVRAVAVASGPLWSDIE